MMRRLIIMPFLLGTALVFTSARAQDVISTFAGGGPNNLAATSANVDQPTSIAVASPTVFYIASPAQNRVFKVDTSATPQFIVFAGNGTPGYSGDAGLAVSAALRSPQAVAVDSSGNVFIADTQNNVVRKVDPSGTITTVAGNGSSGFSGDNGPATQAKLARPFGLAVDSTGIYIADIDNNRVRKVDSSGMITTVAGNGAPGFSGDGGPATVASLNQPMSVALDVSGNLFISDSLNHRVRRVASGVITTFAGNGGVSSLCSTPSGLASTISLSDRTGLGVDTTGNLFIADTDDGCVREVDLTGTMRTVAGTGSFSYSGDGAPASAAGLNGPLGVTAGAGGAIFIADTGNHVIRQFTVGGNITTVAGNGLTYILNPFPPSNINLNSPQGVATDSAGDVFIADTGESIIRVVNTQATAITVTGIAVQPGTMARVAGDGLFGFFGDGSAATSAKLNGPTGVAVDTSGNLYLADASNQRIRKVDTSGNINTVAGSSTTCANPTTTCGDGGPATIASLNFPSSIFVASGNIFIADTDDHRIRRVDGATQIITTVVGNGTRCPNPTTTCGDGGLATIANLNFPSSVFVDGSGNIFIADTGNQRIRRVDAVTHNISTVAGNGTQGSLGDGGSATSAELNAPSSVAVDASGNLFIADFGNQVIRRVDGTSQIITTIAGNGVFGFSGDGGAAFDAKLANPSGVAVAVDTVGNRSLFIADTFNDRIRKVAAPAAPAVSLSPPNLSFPSQLIATESATQTVKLFNTGSQTLNFTGSFAISTDFGESDNCGGLGGSLAPGLNCTITIFFKPSFAGTETGTLTIFDDAPGEPQILRLSGTGFQSSAVLSSTGILFADQLIGTISAPQGLTLQNNGTTPLNITGVAISGDFRGSNNCAASLAPGAMCPFSISFAPTLGGTRNGSLTIIESADTSPRIINLAGNGVGPGVTLSQGSLSFVFNQGVGTASNPLPVTLTSTGTTPLSITSITTSPDFAQSNNCGTSVPPNTSCTINVTFTPTATGQRSGTLTVLDNVAGNPATVSLSGVGAPGYTLTADRTSATVLKGTDSAIFNFSASSPYNFSSSITLSCSGNSPAVCAFNPASITAGQNSALTVSNLNAVTGTSLNFTVTGSSGSQSSSLTIAISLGDFSISSAPPTATVTAGQTATYTLTIQPSGGFSQLISLNCSGAPLAATCSISPSSVSPDGVHPVTATVSITTTALSPAEVSPRITIPGARGPDGLLQFFSLVFASGIALYFSIRRRRIKFLLAMLVLYAITWIACGGGGSGTLPILRGTPSGTYTLNVTANSGGLNHNLNLGLNVN